MGIFDRFRSTSPSRPGDAHPSVSGEDATRLIEQGQALQAQGRLDEAMQCYREAVRLAPNPARAHLNRGNGLLLQGDLDGALAAFRTALDHQPDYAGAHYNIGNALLGNRQLDAAVQNYRKALAINPDYAEVHCSLGVALKELGQLDEAVASFQKALQIEPGLTEASGNLKLALRDMCNIGNVLLNNGQLDGASECFRRALEVDPNFIEAHNNLGNTLQELGLYENAISSYMRALAINPDFADALCNMGLALQALGQVDEAVASYTQALEIKPELAEAHNNLGNSLQTLGRIENAVESYQRALEINPIFTEAHNNLGLSLQHLGQLDDAMKRYRRALELKPDYAEALCNLGNAQQALGQLDSAVTSYLQALEINRDLASVHNNLGAVLRSKGHLEDSLASHHRALEIKLDYAEAHNNLGLVLQDLGQLDDAVASYRNALKIKSDYPEASSNLLLALNYITTHTPSYYAEHARQYGKVVAGKASARFSDWQCNARPESLRVGLVSGDLRNHVVGFFIEGMLAHIDSARVGLVAYPTQHIEDELTARIRPYFSEWKPLACKSDADAARQIHADAVHILIDLSGHTAHNRLPVFAWKPAPVQASWLGYFASTGMAEIDYFFADQVGVPEDQQAQFTESVWYLPGTRLCFTPPQFDLQVAPLPAIKNGHITFGCFQNLSKLGDGVIEVWAKIFSALPNAKLRIQCKQLGDSSQVEKLLQRLRHYGINPEQVMMHKSVQRNAYLAAHTEVDLILDTFPFPGGTTTCEALWMGVPTLTLAGNSLLTRQGASLVTAAGLEPWVATSKEEYVAKAIAFASDLPELSSLRAGLREQVLASPLFDAPRFARNFEDAMWGMWDRYLTVPGSAER